MFGERFKRGFEEKEGVAKAPISDAPSGSQSAYFVQNIERPKAYNFMVRSV